MSEENYIMIQIAQYTYLQIVIETFSDAFELKKQAKNLQKTQKRQLKINISKRVTVKQIETYLPKGTFIRKPSINMFFTRLDLFSVQTKLYHRGKVCNARTREFTFYLTLPQRQWNQEKQSSK